VWTKRCGAAVEVPADGRFLGIDIACTAPFWSVVADRPADAFVKEVIRALNSNGLFDNENDAVLYLSEYRSHHPEKADVDLFLWEVYTARSPLS
jgi:hypothetical protein